MYHEMGARIPPTGKKSRFADVYIYDTDNTAENRKHFYGILRGDLLSRFATMLHEKNCLAHTFTSLRDLMNDNRIPEDFPMVVNAHEKAKPGHARKYKLPESSEVAALIVFDQFGALDFVLRRRVCVNPDGFEKMGSIRLRNRIYDPLCYPLLFPFGDYEWHSKLDHLDLEGKRQKVSRMKLYSRLRFQWESDFNTLIHSSRLFQHYLCEMLMNAE